MFRVSKIFLKEMYTCIQQVCIKLIKSDKDIYNVAVLLNFLFIKESWKTWFPQKY